MRVLHTSDWHLGRTLHGVSLLDAQRRVLGAIVDVARERQVDLVVIAGDLYDRALPPVEALALLDETLGALRDTGARVVAISGNHDSGPRIGFGAALFDRAGVAMRGDLRTAGRPVLVAARDGGPDVAVYPVPYLEPELARHALDVPEARTHEAIVGVALDRARADLAGRPGLRSVAVLHAFVTGGAPSDSERGLTLGGAAYVPASVLSGFDYVALGHLHGPQRVGGDDGRVRYSGSPLAYSFSERAHAKSVVVADLAGDGTVTTELVALPVPRPLAVVRGTLDDLLGSRAHAAAEGAYVSATLTDQVLPREAMARLRARFEHVVVLEHVPPIAPGAGGASAAQRRCASGEADDAELTAGFVEHALGRAASARDRAEIVRALDAVRLRSAA